MRTTYMCKTAFRPLSGDFHESRSIHVLEYAQPEIRKNPRSETENLIFRTSEGAVPSAQKWAVRVCGFVARSF